MILEDATKDAFDYYASDLARTRHKLVLALCIECMCVRIVDKCQDTPLCASCCKRGYRNHFFGKHHSEETKNVLSVNHTGFRNWWFGKHHIEKTKALMRAAHEGVIFTELHKKNLSFARVKQKFPTKYTKPELMFEEICIARGLPFHYTGDNTFHIGSTNPDFMHNTKKIAVEVFGDYRHSPLLRNKISYIQTFYGRKEYFKKRGYKLIIFWESDLKRKDAEVFVMQLLKKEKII